MCGLRVRIPHTLPLDRALYDPLFSCAETSESNFNGQVFFGSKIAAIDSGTTNSTGLFWGTGGVRGVGSVRHSLTAHSYPIPAEQASCSVGTMNSIDARASNSGFSRYLTPPPPLLSEGTPQEESKSSAASDPGQLSPSLYTVCKNGLPAPHAVCVYLTQPHQPGMVTIPLTNKLRSSVTQWRLFSGTFTLDDATPVPRGTLHFQSSSSASPASLHKQLYVTPVVATLKASSGEILWESPPLYRSSQSIPFSVDITGHSSISLFLAPCTSILWKSEKNDAEESSVDMGHSTGALVISWATPIVLILHPTLSQDAATPGYSCEGTMKGGGGDFTTDSKEGGEGLSQGIQALELLAARVPREDFLWNDLERALEEVRSDGLRKKKLDPSAENGGSSPSICFIRALASFQRRYTAALLLTLGEDGIYGGRAGNKGLGDKSGQYSVLSMSPMPPSLTLKGLGALQILHRHLFSTRPSNDPPHELTPRFFHALLDLLRSTSYVEGPLASGEKANDRITCATLSIVTTAFRALAWESLLPSSPDSPLPHESLLDNFHSLLSSFPKDSGSKIHHLVDTAFTCCIKASLSLKCDLQERLEKVKNHLLQHGGRLAFNLPYVNAQLSCNSVTRPLNSLFSLVTGERRLGTPKNQQPSLKPFASFLLNLQLEAKAIGMGPGILRVLPSSLIELEYSFPPASSEAAMFLLVCVGRACQDASLGEWHLQEGGSSTLPFRCFSSPVTSTTLPTVTLWRANAQALL